ncbi:hypothetical protein GALMADRAFT_220133 [Galerina marginata CBS 339.88]|uniref:Cation efflux protein transmembrane domain-containing protein n=1 Tax=Galerina marginata (strain CBS 339.88) TaxID=685588 RepID=A0A067TWM3_GALM3|nr:hypothetical protein GALMADRAFT_220133 [Galerina marginata CBS 339.88]
MPSYRRLQQYAIAISIISVIYNGAEGGLSIGFGAESKSRALIFYGIQSGIEVISALLVVWRFRNIAKPGEERETNLNSENLRFEKLGTISIGVLLIALALGTVASSIAILVLHQEPDSSNASLIISASAIVIMVLIWLPKRYLATALDSSTMRGEAICSLSCIQLTCVLFAGSLIFRLWRGGWWVDGATSMCLSILFGWEGFKMVRWASSTEFTGGCCDDCRLTPESEQSDSEKDVELGIKEKGVSESKQGGCCSPNAGDVGKSGKESACCGPPATSGKKDNAKEVNAVNPVSLAPDSTDVQVSEEKKSEVTEESEDEKSCCSDCD